MIVMGHHTFVLLGSIVLTALFVYCFLCFTSPVSFTGSYTEDEPLSFAPSKKNKISSGRSRVESGISGECQMAVQHVTNQANFYASLTCICLKSQHNLTHAMIF